MLLYHLNCVWLSLLRPFYSFHIILVRLVFCKCSECVKMLSKCLSNFIICWRINSPIYRFGWATVFRQQLWKNVRRPLRISEAEKPISQPPRRLAQPPTPLLRSCNRAFSPFWSFEFFNRRERKLQRCWLNAAFCLKAYVCSIPCTENVTCFKRLL